MTTQATQATQAIQAQDDDDEVIIDYYDIMDTKIEELKQKQILAKHIFQNDFYIRCYQLRHDIKQLLEKDETPTEEFICMFYRVFYQTDNRRLNEHVILRDPTLIPFLDRFHKYLCELKQSQSLTVESLLD